MSRIKVLIVDDHGVFLMGLRELMRDAFDVVGEARNATEAVEMTLATRPDVVVMDVGLPGTSGTAATREIKERLPGTAILIVSARDNDQDVLDAIEAGVSGYVLKDEPPRSILMAVQHAAEGRAYLTPLIAKRLMNRVATGGAGETAMPLTKREISVLSLLASGLRNREIGKALCVSERTVGNHITSIYNKLGVDDRAQAIVYAIKTGILRV